MNENQIFILCIKKDYASLQEDLSGWVREIDLIDDDITKWRVVIKCLDHAGPLKDAILEINLIFGIDYPYKQPIVKFTQKIFHPNIDFTTGVLCTDGKRAVIYDVQMLLFTIRNLLTYPSVAIDGSENPVNIEAAGLYSNEPDTYFEVCQKVLEEKNPTDFDSMKKGVDSKGDESNSFIAFDDNSLLRRRRSRRLEPIMRASGLNIAPKGIYATRTNTFRVQLNLKTSDRKFSRTVYTLHDALWLYEIEILSSGMPRSVEYLIENGNYDSLFELNLVSSPAEYWELLGKKIHELYSNRPLLNHEFRAALEAYNQIER